MIIGRGEASGLNDTLLGVFPVVVRGEDMAITVYERGFRLTALKARPGSSLPEELGRTPR